MGIYAFCYVAPWSTSGGPMFTGDPRMIITEDAKKLMDALESSEEQSSNTIIHLAPLPCPLADLNARTCQSVLSAVIKDLRH